MIFKVYLIIMEIDKEIILDIILSWGDGYCDGMELTYIGFAYNNDDEILVSFRSFNESNHHTYITRHINLNTYLIKIREKNLDFLTE